MRSANLPVTCRRVVIGVTLLGLIAAGTACGAATPTRPPTLPTPAGQPTLIGAPPTLSGVQPTVAPLPTVGTPVTATVRPPITTPRQTRVAPTSVPATPKPVALSGRVAYGVVTGPSSKFHTIWIANVDGSAAHQVLTQAQWPALSPDGSRLAYFGRPEGGSEGLYIANADGGNPVLVVIGPGVCCINWSPDKNWIVYANSPKPNQPGGPLAMLKVDGAYKTNVSLNVQGNGPAFSPDSRQVVYSGCLPNTSTCGVLVVSADGTGAPRSLSRDNGGNAHWSPDGRRFVYQARDDAGHHQVFAMNADGSGKKQLTFGKSNDVQPVWSRDGSAIFWRSDQNGTGWAIYVMNADGSNPRKILDNVPPEPDLWGWESLSVAP